MTKTPYDIVREACAKVNPEILQPCKCTRGRITTQAFTNFKCGLCRKNQSWHNGLTPKWCNSCSAERGVCGHCKQPSIENARPIRLADVLLALPKRDKTGKEFQYEASATSLHRVGKGGVYEFAWNLKNDSLEWHRDNQPETIEWLANLLTNK